LDPDTVAVWDPDMVAVWDPDMVAVWDPDMVAVYASVMVAANGRIMDPNMVIALASGDRMDTNIMCVQDGGACTAQDGIRTGGLQVSFFRHSTLFRRSSTDGGSARQLIRT
jgi:hypothetical protein